MAEIESLSIEITAQTADAKAGLESVEAGLNDVSDEALQTAVAMQLLQGRTDEAGDEMTEVTAKSAAASTGLFALGRVANTTTVSFFGLHVSLTTAAAGLTALTIAALPLIGILGALAAAVGGLALGFGAVLLTPLISDFERIKSVAQETLGELKRLLKPIGETFAPLLISALEALPGILDETLARVGGFSEFADLLKGLGAIAADALPILLAGLIKLGEAALPVLKNVFTFLKKEGPPVLNAVGTALRLLGPPLGALIANLFKLLPLFIRLGTVLVGPVLFGLQIVSAVMVGIKETIDLLISGLQEMIGYLKKVDNLAAGAVEKIKEVTGTEVKGKTVASLDLSGVQTTQGQNGTTVNIGTINASSRAEGKAAAEGIKSALRESQSRNVTNTSRGPGPG